MFFVVGDFWFNIFVIDFFVFVKDDDVLGDVRESIYCVGDNNDGGVVIL